MLATTKSSTWLHRLRASRGFPESDHIDLDHFLSTCQPKIDPKPPLPEVADDNNEGRDCDSIAHVLSELFYMGEFHDKSRKKSCRKQHCPKICVVPTDLAPNDSRHKAKVVERVEEKEDQDISAAWSQTEVTVIDTSVPCWKFEKMLYRSKNVWRVRDKKGKGLIIGDSNKRLNEKKKLKKKLKLLNSSKEGSVVLSKFNQGHDQSKTVAANEKKQDKCVQVQERSFCKKQIDEGSSVILIKSIPTTNKKNAFGVSNSCVKSMH